MSAHHDFRNSSFATRIIHVGSEPDPSTGAVCVPICMSTTFAQPSPSILKGTDMTTSFGKGFEYSRTGNPTRGAFEQAVAAAESAKHCVAFASGMAATTAIIHLLKQGDHVISIDDVYGGMQRYFCCTVVPTYGIEFDFVDMCNPEAIRAAWKANTKMVWLETPTNPTLKISDIAAIAEVVHSCGGVLVVDNTFMSPYLQQPMLLGADIVMSSVTKYINGHSDIVMGVVSTSSDAIYEQLRFVQNGVGAIPGPHDCYMALRGLKTLHLRMQRHSENALAVAQFLEASDAVEKVLYPGLPSHPQHEIAKKNSTGNGFSGMVTFYVKGGLRAARLFLENIKVFTLAESLGAVESLAESPALMTHASVPAEKRKELNISDNLVRLSVGVEDISDLLDDLKNALAVSQTAE
jgi:cystathionine gamma-lyase